MSYKSSGKVYCGITANRERCQAMVERSVGIITALVPYIGYEKATNWPKKL